MNALGGAFSVQFSQVSGDREWFTAAELAELALPGLPADKRALNRRIADEGWKHRIGLDGAALCRPHFGKGGGKEYHVSLLPGSARIELAKRGLVMSTGQTLAEAELPSAGSWRWYDAQNAKTKAEAERRNAIVAEIDVLFDACGNRTAAVAEASRRHGVGKATLWAWLKLIEGVARTDRLPALAPRRQGGGSEVEIDAELWKVFESDYLRPSCPTLSACYARAAAIAKQNGLSMASEKTFRRRVEALHPGLLLARRKGPDAVRRSLPAQRRTVSELHALECVNIDGHVFDVRVQHPEKPDQVIRPVLVGIQDIRSSKVLAWRIGVTESAALVRLVFADLFRDFGIPVHCLLDNGRGFASKWITGATANRFRFKVKPEDPVGLLTGLNIQVHWALPYRGQSKPIERAWRDLCEGVSKHPATEGAYVGNNPVNKPHNYGQRAMGWDEFRAHVERGIAFHNAKSGRTGRDYKGRSFDDVFAASYADSVVRKATPEQMRMALLAAEQKTLNRQTGEITLFGNRYWSPECSRFHGQRVTVRFDPDNLLSDVHLYGQDGRYLASAQIVEDSGFLDVAGAKATAKRHADHRALIRAVEQAEQLLTAEQVARMQADAPDFSLPEPAAVRPVRHRGATAAALKAAPVPQQAQHESKVFAALGNLRVVE